MIKNLNIEIDIYEYLRIIYKYKWILIFLVFIGFMCGYFYAQRKPNMYESSLVFFLPMTETASASLDSSYAQLLNMSSSSSGFADYLFMLMNSRLFKKYVYDDLKTNYNYIEKLDTNLDLSKLKLAKIGTLTFSISFQSPDKNLIVPVLDSALKSLQKLNEKFNIIAQKDFIIVLDEAEKPQSPLNKNINRSIIIFTAAALGIGLFFIFLLEFLIRYFRGEIKL
ncbi:MAG: Wzz/FepE/Etk N-terminal domain-containing protein [Candidatus Margulisiibacteriota bacterium]|jgi:uncharacterized protein involved in exopolysaccharide biosynthesis